MISRRLTVSLVAALLAFVLASPSAHAREKEKTTIVKDPHYGEVLFYFYQDDYFPAITRLLASQQQQKMANHSEEAELLLGGLYLSYGHHLRASEIFERLLAGNVDVDIRNRTWFFLAKIWRQRGYMEKSQQALNNIEGELPKDMESERYMLQAQLLINGGEHDKAIALLQEWKGKTEWASYARFNLGVAMVRSGRVDDAAKVLDGLGQMDPFNEELMALRDKANLALGYAYLQDGQPLQAKPVLQRVRLDGPFSNKALLGVGWADAEEDSYDRALVPWMELKDRNLLDPAVQESMLAIPYALAKLNGISQAADHYLNAIEAFHEESARIDETILKLESGEMFDQFLDDDSNAAAGWYWRLEELPKGQEARYLFAMLASHEFQEGLKNYRDLAYLQKNLNEWQGNLEVYRNMLDTREMAYQDRLPRIEQALVDADIDGVIGRKMEFDAYLNTIEQNSDVLALATTHEFELWGEITAIERRPALQADIPEAQEVRDKVAMLKGVLQWNLEKEFKGRLWKVRKDLRETGEALVETQRARRQVDETMREEPALYASLNGQVNSLRPRIDALKVKVDLAMAEQRAFLRGVAVDELMAQKQRLQTYTVQARFALADIYDRGSTVEVASQ